MAKYPSKTRIRDPKKAELVKKTASITKKSESMVYRVIAGERENEDVLSVYMFLLQGGNKLVEEAKKLVPFNQKPTNR